MFVAVSINLKQILASPRLPGRAFEALIVLVSILIVSSLMLVPDQPIALMGSEVLVMGIGIWIIVTRINMDNFRKTDPQYHRQALSNILLNQLALLPSIISGISLLTWGIGGLYWLVPAFILSLIKALLDAWVLLIEINR
jgi:modulator of FtsH protease